VTSRRSTVPASFNLADLVEGIADAIGEREAVLCDGRRLTFAEFDERATRLAHVMAGHGVGPGDHVALHLYNGNEYLEAMVAAFKLRAVPINVNYRYVADELRYLFDDADIRLVVREPDLPRVLDGPEVVRGDDYERQLASAPSERDFAPRSADDLYILYTGGTTGPPKGVMWRQEDIFFAAFGGGNPGGKPVTRPSDVIERARQGHHRCLPACPLMHGAAHWMAWQSLLAGGSAVLLRQPGFDPEAVLDAAAAEGVSFLVIVGDAFARPLADALLGQPGRWDLHQLTVILSGGAILSPSVKADLLRALPAAMVVDGFGASETGGQGQTVAVAGVEAGARPRFPAGKRNAVLGPDLRPVRPGETGRLARCGRIPLGYYKDPEKTAATFPEVDGVRWAVPGDLARLEPDGSITVFGRGSVSINTGGEKVHPEEVESALKAHASVFDAVVVGRPHDIFGETVVAVVSVRPGREAPDIEALREHCRARLAAYKCPRDIVFVDEVVRSPSGKPDYGWARLAADPVTGAGRPSPA
jgi:3-oxocholest-4-en-26-oate---CoA ligase